MRSVAAAIAGLVIRLSSPIRYGNARETSIRKRAVFSPLSRDVGLDSASASTLGTPCHDQGGDEENQVQKRPEIDFFFAEVAHAAGVENREAECAGHDG